MAQLAAVELSTLGEGGRPWTVSCHSFGSFRVGDRAFVDLYESAVHESGLFCHRLDPVTQFPPTTCGYEDGARTIIDDPFAWYPHAIHSYISSIE